MAVRRTPCGLRWRITLESFQKKTMKKKRCLCLFVAHTIVDIAYDAERASERALTKVQLGLLLAVGLVVMVGER